MKWIFVAISTFILGIGSVILFGVNQIECDLEPLPVAFSPPPPPAPSFLYEPETVSATPFFQSFEEDEFFTGWLIADEFTGMKEVWTISLDNMHDNGKRGWSAMVFTSLPDGTPSEGSPNEDDNFNSIQIQTENDHLSFKTNKIRGIQYEFDGRFFKSGKDFSEDEKILTGTMRKIVKGKEVAKFTADFAYAEPHCLH